MNPKLTEPVLVRRLKDDLRKIRGGFPERRVEQIDVKDLPEDQPELKLAALLDEYREVRDQRLAGESKRVQASSGLLICGLQQRAPAPTNVKIRSEVPVPQFAHMPLARLSGAVPIGFFELLLQRRRRFSSVRLFAPITR